MKKFRYYIASVIMLSAMTLSFTSCSEDDLGPSIFPEINENPDPASSTYQLDMFCKNNFLDVYNLEFLYKMADISADMNYNLVPATYSNSVDMAVLIKYLWFDAYDKIAGPNFLKQYGPRIIQLVGSPSYNGYGEMVVGLSESGMKVSLFRVNSMMVNDYQSMNEYYFSTMHHEFAHILHQTKTYPPEFKTLSVGKYDAASWTNRDANQMKSQGFVTTYASSEVREDFAEIVANYIISNDAEWEYILDLASRGWEKDASDLYSETYYCYYYYNNNDQTTAKIHLNEDDVFTDASGNKYYRDNKDSAGNRLLVYDVEDTDDINGREVIEQKLQIVRQWFLDAWDVDLDALRQEVQYRQTHYDINQLRKQVYDIQ